MKERGVFAHCRKARCILSILVLVASIILADCFMPLPKAEASPDIIYSDSSDGYIVSTPRAFGDRDYMIVGDGDLDRPAQGFVRFSLAGISGTLSYARLYLYVNKSYHDSTGDLASPLTNPGLGPCQVYHIDDYGALDSTDYNPPSIGNDPGVLISETATPNIGYVSIDVTAAIQDDIDNAKAYTSFMIKLFIDTDSDAKYDEWFFSASERVGTDQDPYVKYALVSPLSWTQVNTDGFGDPNNEYAEDQIEFGDYIYIGADNSHTGIEVWRSSDGATWAQVGGDGFGDAQNQFLLSFEVFQSELYASIQRSPPPYVVRIYRSSDGASWTQTGTDGFGDANNLFAYLCPLDSYLAAFTYNTVTGTEIWTWNGSSWTQRMGDGIDGGADNHWSYPLGKFDGYWYLSTMYSSAGAELWRSSDGIYWNKVNNDGFDGDAGNRYIRDIEKFDGYLYAVTNNRDTGMEIWCSNDGTTWNKIGDDGLGDPKNYRGRFLTFKEDLCLIADNWDYSVTPSAPAAGVKVFRSSDGTGWSQVNEDGFNGDANNREGYAIVGGDNLYVVTSNEVTGVKVWRSSDGTSWNQVNTNGFGDLNNKYSWVRFIFDNHLYVTVNNVVTGFEVWRLDEPVAQPDFQITASPDSLSLSQGGFQTSIINVTSLNGFSSSVELAYSWLAAVPSGVTVDLPSPVTPPADGQATSTLTSSASSTASVGSFTLRVTCSSGTLTHHIDIAVTIAEATPTPSPSPSPSPTPACIIATAAYNCPLAPEVTYMRHVRDDLIGSTKIGQLLVGGWNLFYHSWSPPVARFIDRSDILKFTFRVLLLPLLGVVYIAAQQYNSLMWLNPDLASIIAFATAAVLSTAIYLVLPLLVIKTRTRFFRKAIIRPLKASIQ